MSDTTDTDTNTTTPPRGEWKKDLWNNMFSVHDRLKFYYVQLAMLLILAFPLRFLFSASLWRGVFATPESVENFTMLMYLLLILFWLVVGVVYFTFWRFLFPRYVMVCGRNTYPGGRCYFYSSSPLALWSQRKREWAGCPVVIPQPYLWVCNGLLNPFNPWGSMNRVWLPQGTHFIRDTTRIYVWEGGHKRKHISQNGGIEYVLESDGVIGFDKVDNNFAAVLVDGRLQEMITSTQKAAQASIPHIQRALEHGSFDISWSSKKQIDDIYREKEEAGLL